MSTVPVVTPSRSKPCHTSSRSLIPSCRVSLIRVARFAAETVCHLTRATTAASRVNQCGCPAQRRHNSHFRTAWNGGSMCRWIPVPFQTVPHEHRSLILSCRVSLLVWHGLPPNRLSTGIRYYGGKPCEPSCGRQSRPATTRSSARLGNGGEHVPVVAASRSKPCHTSIVPLILSCRVSLFSCGTVCRRIGCPLGLRYYGGKPCEPSSAASLEQHKLAVPHGLERW